MNLDDDDPPSLARGILMGLLISLALVVGTVLIGAVISRLLGLQ